MSGPVVFVSHFAVKEGRLDDLRALAAEIEAQLRDEKPGTLAYLMYLDEQGSRFTVAHCFSDAEAMDRHFEGSDDRTAAAFEVMTPLGWEIYGRPSDAALASMREGAEATGVPLIVLPDHVGGFLRLASA
jgi:quinol monooxygenase YgiN